MKKILLLAVIVCISMTIKAQKCKYDYEKKDVFTGKMTKGITETIKSGIKLEFKREDESYSIGLSFALRGVNHDIMAKGDTLMIALENSTPLIFVVQANALPTQTAISQGANGFLSYYNPNYTATVEQIRKLSLNKIIAVKFYVGSDKEEIEVSSRKADNIIQATTCMLK